MPLAITGSGLVSSLGLGVGGTCSALRAGVVRPAELDAEVGDGEGGTVPVVGYPASPVADGFTQQGAWIQLASEGIADLRHAGALPPDKERAFWGRATLVGVLPRIETQRFQWSLADFPDAASRFFLDPLIGLSLPGLPATTRRQWDASGHVSFATATIAAERELSVLASDRALIVAADSFVDPSTLAWLAWADRLKSADRPTGMMPGEAGAALLVETEHAARLRKAPVLAWIDAVAVNGPLPPAPPRAPVDRPGEADDLEDAAWLPPPAPRLGRSIAEAIRKVLPPPAQGARWRGDLFLDLNGEYWRAEAWGHANVHLIKHLDVEGSRVFLPAESLGETGAASAPIAVALALWSFNRDRTEQAIVVSVADDGAASAIRLSAPR